MTDKITKLNYEPGDPINTSSVALRCPNGHPLQTFVTKRKGQGRVSCPVCSWSDAQPVMGTTPARAESTPVVAQAARGAKTGVTIISQRRGIEEKKGVEIVRRP